MHDMSKLTTHILDTANGCPGKGISIRLFRGDDMVAEAVTNDDGRCDSPLLQGENFTAGVYQIEFDAGDYYRTRGMQLPEPAFLDTVIIQFGIADEDAHYHVPLLISPYGYSTYRGS